MTPCSLTGLRRCAGLLALLLGVLLPNASAQAAESLLELTRRLDQLDDAELREQVEISFSCSAKRDFACAQLGIDRAAKLASNAGQKQLVSAAVQSLAAEKKALADAELAAKLQDIREENERRERDRQEELREQRLARREEREANARDAEERARRDASAAATWAGLAQHIQSKGAEVSAYARSSAAQVQAAQLEAQRINRARQEEADRNARAEAAQRQARAADESRQRQASEAQQQRQVAEASRREVSAAAAEAQRKTVAEEARKQAFAAAGKPAGAAPTGTTAPATQTLALVSPPAPGGALAGKAPPPSSTSLASPQALAKPTPACQRSEGVARLAAPARADYLKDVVAEGDSGTCWGRKAALSFARSTVMNNARSACRALGSGWFLQDGFKFDGYEQCPDCESKGEVLCKITQAVPTCMNEAEFNRAKSAFEAQQRDLKQCEQDQAQRFKG